MRKKNLKEKLIEMRYQLENAPYIHGVDIRLSLEQITQTLLETKRLGVTYIYDLQGVVGLYWKPKSRFLSNEFINSEDDVYMFITGMSKEEYSLHLNDVGKKSKK